MLEQESLKKPLLHESKKNTGKNSQNSGIEPKVYSKIGSYIGAMLKRIKCLGINWMKGVQYLYPKNYKTSLEENLNKWKGISGSCSKRVNMKMTVLPKLIYRITVTLIKIPATFCHKLTNFS